jgi:hypothetical protein
MQLGFATVTTGAALPRWKSLFQVRQLITNAIDGIGGYVVWLFQMGTHPLGCVPCFLDCIMPKLNLAKQQSIFCCRTEPKGRCELCTYRL